MKTELKIKITPTQTDLKKIEKWLIKEEQTSIEGFYSNWKTIIKAFNNNKLITLNLKNNPIGFSVWSEGEISIDIDIFEIKPNQRNKGIGKAFFEYLGNYFKQKGYLLVKLYCSPRESEKFWKKIGFIKFPNRQFSESDLTYFKPLIEIQQPNLKINKTDNVIELWDVEPYQKNNNQPKWIWNIELHNNKLELPIIFPCNYNWNLKWTKKGKVIRENKIKYFNTEENKVEYDTFLYIEKLIE